MKKSNKKYKTTTSNASVPIMSGEVREKENRAQKEPRQYVGFINRHRRGTLFLIDLTVLFVAVLVNCIFNISWYQQFPRFLATRWPAFLSIAVCLMGGRLISRTYKNIWRYPNTKAYLTMVISDGLSGTVAFLFNRFAYRFLDGTHTKLCINVGFWQTFCVIALFCLTTLVLRFAYQMLCLHVNIKDGVHPKKTSGYNKINVVIVGAGRIGALLAEELIANTQSHYRPYCFIEQDPVKIGGLVCGLKVYAETDDIVEKIKSWPVQEIFLAMPNLDPDKLNELYDKYTQTGCKVKLYSLPTGDKATLYRPPSAKGMIRKLTPEDYVNLLGRDPLLVNNDETRAFYRDKVVLVTGGGGSIGSEICRQIAKCNPKQLIIFDIYENNAYDIQMELLQTYGTSLDLRVEIGSVRDVQRLDCVFAYYKPDVVFHAAAHKHVPLMEHSNCEAIKNNVLGTYNTANMAEKYGVHNFVLISTDKAVNPTNVMGASKRMCEMVIQCRRDSKTTFAAVRFGNVLGSNGSVIPLFQNQIAKGGPVTITHKDIIRYFMTIPEASQLVMQAGAMAKPGELFVLKMGAPVKILSLATNLIYLSGFIPGKDIEIKEVGLRPGEKLYEQTLIKSENTLINTDNELILIEEDPPLSRQEVEARLSILRDALEDAANDIESPIVREAMKKVVPTFREPEEVNKTAAESEEMHEATELVHQ